MTSARRFSDLSSDSKPNVRNVPNGVGRLVSATFVAFMSGIISRGRGLAAVEDNVVVSSSAAVGTSGD